MKAIRLILVLTLVFGGAVAVSAQSSIDVTIVKPDIRLQGSLSDAQSAFDNTAVRLRLRPGEKVRLEVGHGRRSAGSGSNLGNRRTMQKGRANHLEESLH